MRKILGRITPGGGKSTWPQLIARDLIPTRVDKIAWIVPRLTLAQQGAQNFVDPASRSLLGHQLEIRQSTNDLDPSRGLAGFVTTYQAVATDPKTVVDELKRFRYAVVLDEPHHVERGGIWHQKLQPIVDLAKVLVMMTGTLDRANLRPVAFLEYVARSADGLLIVDRAGGDWRVLEYGRSDAIREQAIIRLEFRFHDSKGVIQGLDGEGNRIESVLSEAGEDVRAVLGAALDTRYAKELLEYCVKDWRAYQGHHPWAKLLVVARSIEAAKKTRGWLRSMSVAADIATSDDSVEALANINRFKGSSDCLITVAMAYEGLDVKAITHIACLTHYRSTPWIEQMVARAVRVYDGPQAPPWEAQRAIIYAPDDRLMREIWALIKVDQEAGAREPGNGPGGGNGPAIAIGIDGSADTGRAETDDHSYDLGRTAVYNQVAGEFGLAGVDTVADIVRKATATIDLEELRVVAPTPAILTPNQREDSKKRWIENICRRLDGNGIRAGDLAGDGWGTHNRLLYARFHKSRENMRENELDAVIAW
ncbi:MAG: hypothetical protein DLM66_00005, partial [Candidatus Dormiibacter spiritus]